MDEGSGDVTGVRGEARPVIVAAMSDGVFMELRRMPTFGTAGTDVPVLAAKVRIAWLRYELLTEWDICAVRKYRVKYYWKYLAQ